MIKNRDEMNNECDMLRGNINRICVTNDIKELERMIWFAELRLKEIIEFNKDRIVNGK